MLTYDQIATCLHKWAFKYQNKDFEYWELINAVWVKGAVQKLPHVQFASNRVKWDMIDYMRSVYDPRATRRREAADKHALVCFSINQPLENTEIGNFIENKAAEPVASDMDTDDYFAWLAKGLLDVEAIVLRMRFLEDQKLKDIGAVLNLTESRVSQLLAQLLTRLKHKLSRGDYNHANRVCTTRIIPSRDKNLMRRYNRQYYTRNSSCINYKRRLKRNQRTENEKNVTSGCNKAEFAKS